MQAYNRYINNCFLHNWQHEHPWKFCMIRISIIGFCILLNFMSTATIYSMQDHLIMMTNCASLTDQFSTFSCLSWLIVLKKGSFISRRCPDNQVFLSLHGDQPSGRYMFPQVDYKIFSPVQFNHWRVAHYHCGKNSSC